MLKKYKCRLSATNLLVKIDGKVKHVEFKPDVLLPSSYVGCSFSTENVALQKAIEADKRFNSQLRDGFWTDDVEPKEAPKKEVKQSKKNKL